jgi:TRAP-type C4-dicarboxylate transport system substrate-binding protein
MNFIREKETKYMLDNYKSMTPQNLLDYFMQRNNDSDCIYIFNRLPRDLQKTVDDLAGEVVKANNDKLKANNDKLKELDVMIEFVTQYNKQLDDDIYRLQHKLENTRELNRQLGIF